MQYYQVRIKALSTGRYFSVFFDGATGPWVRNGSGLTAEFHLRKIDEKRFIFGIDGGWAGVEEGWGIMCLSIRFTSAGKEQAFEITPQSYHSNRVRIKSLANGMFLHFVKGYADFHVVRANFTPTANLDDDGVFVLEPIKTKLEFLNQGDNITQRTVVPVPEVLNNIRPLDGIKVQLQSVYLKQYLCTENGGVAVIAANSNMPFELWALPDTRKYLFQVSSGKFMGLEGKQLVALADTPGKDETFEIVQKANDFTRVRIKSWDGKFLQAKQESITADADELTPDPEKWNGWSDDDPTIFLLIVIGATIPNGRTIKAIEGATRKLNEHPSR